MGRRLAREIALKILYRYEEGDHDVESIFSTVLHEKKYTENDREFCTRLVQLTIENMTVIDDHITAVLENWPYDRISVIDKSILRMSTCEIIYFDDIPPRVTINEAIEIGKKYSSAESGKFINGVLDAVKRKHEGSDN